MHGRGLFTRNGPITPRDRCYLFIILLNVDRRGAKATGSFLELGHCSEIFVCFNEHPWASRRFDRVVGDSTRPRDSAPRHWSTL